MKQEPDNAMTTVQLLYRNKPSEYFVDISKNHSDVMKPYLKDNHGDAASPINERLNGLFFSANSSGGVLPTASPFGEMRFTIPVERIVSPSCHLYFADFYCNKGPRHYVTVVVTKKQFRSRFVLQG